MMANQHKHDTKHWHGSTIRWWAPAYEAVSWLMSFGQKPAMTKHAIKAAKLQARERVLDVGCGPGSLTLPATERVAPGGYAAGIDASPEMIDVATRKAKSRGLGVDFRVASIEALPFGEAEFDAALSSLMLHHLPDDVKATGLAEVFRVLKPGGRLIAVDLAGGHSPVNFIMSLVGHRTPDDYVDTLIAKIEEAGFTDVERLKSKWSQLAYLRAVKPATTNAEPTP
jgi:demethylmenaquinone methyltransferase/2-methoxy-6-polyprenyl-1,4-benzoquinol methylase/phosphoethanolamine N-methyltransferase